MRLISAGASFLIVATANAGELSAPSLIDACRAAPDATARIACLEDAVRTIAGAAPEGDLASAAPAAETAPEPSVSEPATETLTAAPAAPSTAPAASEPPTGLGAEQVLAREDRRKRDQGEEPPKETVAAAVEEFSYNGLGRLIVFLDNGQVWREKSGERQAVKLSTKRDYTVEISESAISGYRMTIPELKRTVRVERLK